MNLDKGSLIAIVWFLFATLALAAALGCASGDVDPRDNSSDSDSDNDSDSDTDSDSDSDTDTDSDSDSDSDSDTDSDSDSDSDGDCTQVNVISDGSFEVGTPSTAWTESSTNFGTPLCDSSCSTNTDFIPHTGSWYAWFGGSEIAPEVSSLSQSVNLGDGPAAIEFYLRIPASAGASGDYLHVSVDGTQVFSVTTLDAASYPVYTLVGVDISAWGDGGAHTISFDSTSNGSASGVTDFFIDDVVVNACP